ncbi:MAG: ABC transporter permease [Anaerolineae bacterium]|nr:ABC transporter permease [Anaerolineae bacterium]MCI0609341.1 ABC transporter permease [Anaerolineae bacterium]
MTSTAIPKTTVRKGMAESEIENPWRLAWRRFRRHKAAVAALAGMFTILAYIWLGGLFFSRGLCEPTGKYLTSEAYANCNDLAKKLQPPSREHPFGTDTIGRDILARTIYGGQISLTIGIFAAIVEVVVGVLIGAVAGYFGGWIDDVLMRITEAMLIIPSLFLLLVLSKALGGRVPPIDVLGRTFSGSVIVIILVIGFTSWTYLARIVRANVLSLKQLDFISASRALGVSDARIIFRHLLPNTMAPIIVSSTLGVSAAILSESYVSFLGLGVQTPTASWGNMLDTAVKYVQTAPWLWFFPGLFILLTVLCINFIGDGLRDALDPRSTKHI